MPSSPVTAADEEKGAKECHPLPSGSRWKEAPAFRRHLGWAEILAVDMNMHQPRKSGGKAFYLAASLQAFHGY